MNTKMLAEKALQLRKEKGLTQKGLAELLKITPQAISLAERDVENTSMNNLRIEIINQLSGQKVEGPYWFIDPALKND